jgi:hypothetical protein
MELGRKEQMEEKKSSQREVQHQGSLSALEEGSLHQHEHWKMAQYRQHLARASWGFVAQHHCQLQAGHEDLCFQTIDQSSRRLQGVHEPCWSFALSHWLLQYLSPYLLQSSSQLKQWAEL